MVYSGKTQLLSGEPDLGASFNVVLHLANSIHKGINHLLYFWSLVYFPSTDDLFSQQKDIFFGNTQNKPTHRFLLCQWQRSFEERMWCTPRKSALVNDVEVHTVKWMDNSSVNLLSTFASAQRMDECNWYDKKAKNMTMISCYAIVKEYHKFMGGVDLMDCLIALYRIYTHSKKFYHKIFIHFLDVAVVNFWLLHHRQYPDLGVPSQ